MSTLPMVGGSYHAVILGLLKSLFTAEEGRIERQLEEIFKTHCQLKGEITPGFLFNGDFYCPKSIGPINGRVPKKSLDITLEGTMRAYLKDVNQVAIDRAVIGQMIFKALGKCATEQDVRDALPNCITNELPEVAGLSRTREPGFVFEDDRRAWKQFQTILPKMDMYAAGKLFY